ncbi:MAG TPA: hypothetical protein VKF60_14900 [Myxococcota bacterium]|nr:hypothetical protein [Myxococcota bacterium]
MSRALRSVAVGLLIACAQAGVPGSSGVGQFVSAGPVAGDSELRVRWRYGFRFSVDPSSVSEVKLSCGAIDGSAFVVEGADIHVDASRTAYWEGPERLLTEDSVPWLFDPETTSEICQAVVSRAELPDAVERMGVTFTSAVKSGMLIDLRLATEFDRK